MPVPLTDDTLLELTPAGRRALAEARVLDALATLPGWQWDDDHAPAVIARAAIAAYEAR